MDLAALIKQPDTAGAAPKLAPAPRQGAGAPQGLGEIFAAALDALRQVPSGEQPKAGAASVPAGASEGSPGRTVPGQATSAAPEPSSGVHRDAGGTPAASTGAREDGGAVAAPGASRAFAADGPVAPPVHPADPASPPAARGTQPAASDALAARAAPADPASPVQPMAPDRAPPRIQSRAGATPAPPPIRGQPGGAAAPPTPKPVGTAETMPRVAEVDGAGAPAPGADPRAGDPGRRLQERPPPPDSNTARQGRAAAAGIDRVSPPPTRPVLLEPVADGARQRPPAPAGPEPGAGGLNRPAMAGPGPAALPEAFGPGPRTLAPSPERQPPQIRHRGAAATTTVARPQPSGSSAATASSSVAAEGSSRAPAPLSEGRPELDRRAAPGLPVAEVPPPGAAPRPAPRPAPHPAPPRPDPVRAGALRVIGAETGAPEQPRPLGGPPADPIAADPRPPRSPAPEPAWPAPAHPGRGAAGPVPPGPGGPGEAVRVETRLPVSGQSATAPPPGSPGGDIAATPAPGAGPAQGPGPMPGISGPAAVGTEGARAILPQIGAAIAGHPGTGRITVHLDPPELGRIDIAIEIGDQGLRATLVAERGATGELIRRHGDLLVHQFQEAGFGDIDLEFADAERETGRGAPGPGARDGHRPGEPEAPEARETPTDARSAAGSGRLDLRL